MNGAVANQQNLMRARKLLTEMLTVSSHIKDYNFRHYFIRRTNIDIDQLNQHSSDQQDLEEGKVDQYVERLEQLKRI